MKELKLKRCLKCGALIKVLRECNCDNCDFSCCNSLMKDVIANSVDASFEKHVPSYEVCDGKIYIKVNHVMDDDHYIEWILVKSPKETREVLLNPGDNPSLVVPYEKGSLLYAYCNKHGLWKKEVL